eukprot:1161198-Pelagomonas_calceolata.AAC.9
MQRLTTVFYTRQVFAYCGLLGEVAERAEVDTRRRRVQASRGMADNPPDPHWFSLSPSPRLAVASVVLRDLCEALASLLVTS